MRRNKKFCNKCKQEISCSNFKRHYDKCCGIKDKLISVDKNWLQNDGKYKCPYCNENFSKMGISSHIILMHLHIERQKNNLINYNEKVKLGFLPKNKNQFQLAKEQGNQYIVSNEVRKKIATKKLGQHLSKETREKISTARSKYLENVGGGGFTVIKWYKLQNIKQEEFIVRGNWEREVGEILNNENIYWVRKKYLKYQKNNIIKTYSPDFYLPEHDLYIEVKGYYSQHDKEKIDLVRNQNSIKLILIFDKDLKIIRNIGIKKYWDVSALSYTQ